MRTRSARAAPLLLVGLLLAVGVVRAVQNSATAWYVLSGGGGWQTSGGSTLESSIGLPVAFDISAGGSRLCAGFVCGLAAATPSATATATPTHTLTPSRTATRSATPSPTASATKTLTLTPSPTATATKTPTLTPSPTATATKTLTPTPSPTATVERWYSRLPVIASP